MNYGAMSLEQFRQEVCRQFTLQEIASIILGSEPPCKRVSEQKIAGNHRGECLVIAVPSTDDVKIINSVGQYVTIHWGKNRTEGDKP